MSEIKTLTDLIVVYRDARDWKQFHNPKDMAIPLALEASEVLEHFQWKSNEEIAAHIETKKSEIGEELADVLYWILLMSHDLDIDISKVFEEKMIKNDTKYPIDKAKGRHTKYTEL